MFVGMLYIEGTLSDSVDCAVVNVHTEISLLSCKTFLSQVFLGPQLMIIGHW